MGNLINDLDNNLVDEQYSNLTKIGGYSASATPLTPVTPPKEPITVPRSGNTPQLNTNPNLQENPVQYPNIATDTGSPRANETGAGSGTGNDVGTGSDVNDSGNLGDGGTFGGGGGSAPQEEATEGGGGALRVGDKKILGLSPKMFYSILAVATLVGGYYAFKYKVIKL